MRKRRQKITPEQVLLPTEPVRHTIAPGLMNRTVKVFLIGAGGSGSQMLTRLARLDYALRALGHPGGLSVTLWDDDTVSAANVGRQLFYPSDIGLSKAAVLINRINQCFGLTWQACDKRFTGDHGMPHILITCVDTAQARREIHKNTRASHPDYWLDMGNSAKSGQVFLTQPALRPVDFKPPSSVCHSQADLTEALQEGMRRMNAQGQAEAVRLPDLSQVLPEMLDPTEPEDNAPSCSLAEALEKQDLAVNDAVTTWAFHLLWTLFREGGLKDFGYWINLAEGRVVPVPVSSIVPASVEGEKVASCRKAGRNG